MTGHGKTKISRIVKIVPGNDAMELNVPNPFSDKLIVQINSAGSQLVRLNLIDNSGRFVRSQQFVLTDGTNNLQLNDTGNLPKGLYTVQIQMGAQAVHKKVIKQ